MDAPLSYLHVSRYTGKEGFWYFSSDQDPQDAWSIHFFLCMPAFDLIPCLLAGVQVYGSGYRRGEASLHHDWLLRISAVGSAGGNIQPMDDPKAETTVEGIAQIGIPHCDPGYRSPGLADKNGLSGGLLLWPYHGIFTGIPGLSINMVFADIPYSGQTIKPFSK
jgi:hypothetical protein